MIILALSYRDEVGRLTSILVPLADRTFTVCFCSYFLANALGDVRTFAILRRPWNLQPIVESTQLRPSKEIQFIFLFHVLQLPPVAKFRGIFCQPSEQCRRQPDEAGGFILVEGCFALYLHCGVR